MFASRLLRNSVLLGAALVLAATAPVQANETGSGPLTISQRAASYYENVYLEDEGRRFFAVSRDGKSYGYSRCSDFRCAEWQGRSVAIRTCQKHSKGVPCFIYADRNSVIWNGTVTIAASDAERSPTHASIEGGDGRLVWGGGRGRGKIEMFRDPSTLEGKLTARLRDGALCEGAYSKDSRRAGSWSLTCADGSSAQGTYDVGGTTIVGFGEDSGGEKVSFSVEN